MTTLHSAQARAMLAQAIEKQFPRRTIHIVFPLERTLPSANIYSLRLQHYPTRVFAKVAKGTRGSRRTHRSAIMARKNIRRIGTFPLFVLRLYALTKWRNDH
jgi:hypothetical protein